MSSSYYTLQLVGYSLFNVNLCGVSQKVCESYFYSIAVFDQYSSLFVGYIVIKITDKCKTELRYVFDQRKQSGWECLRYKDWGTVQ